MLIYKEALLNSIGVKRLYLPFDTVEEAKKNILKIGLQYGDVHMWFQVLDKPQKEFVLISMAMGTNHPKLTLENYIGSESLFDGEYVLDYFLVDLEVKNRDYLIFE